MGEDHVSPDFLRPRGKSARTKNTVFDDQAKPSGLLIGTLGRSIPMRPNTDTSIAGAGEVFLPPRGV